MIRASVKQAIIDELEDLPHYDSMCDAARRRLFKALNSVDMTKNELEFIKNLDRCIKVFKKEVTRLVRKS